MTILKVQLRDEIRRVTIDGLTIQLEDLENKVRGMFPHLDDFLLQYTDADNTTCDIFNDDDLTLALMSANTKQPPILRLNIQEGSSRSAIRQEAAALASSIMDEPALLESSEEGASPSDLYDVDASSANCSFCNESIGWISFKCVNCMDILLCEDCESNAVHDCTHLLVKLRIPFETLPLKQQLIFTEHILNQEHRSIANQKRKELRKMIRTKEKVQTKADRVKARKERIRRRFEAKKKLDEKAKRSVKKSVGKSKKSKKNPKKEGVLATVDEPAPQPLVDEIDDGFVTLVESPLPTVEEIEEPIVAEQPERLEEIAEVPSLEEAEVDPIVTEEELEEEEEEEEAWGFYDMITGLKGIGETLGSTVAGVLSSSEDSEEQHRIQGIAFRQKLEALETMGFTDKNKNILLLVKHLANLEATVDDLVASEVL
eukprot:TRINITY_DN2117_c0_g1_i2.p1 TRINITY_DN2117_c0_g1~~TRINITY_DN2117_c0_g1_i2.p1  ORF type:complete len:429 (-),score=124.29 TRINITY_DN2117_c0_g1_i2:63-1349(-)